MKKSLFSNINGFNEIAINNIKEVEEINFELKYEDDFTSIEAESVKELDYVPFEQDIIVS